MWQVPGVSSLLPPATPYVNTAPRYFWGPLAPTAPNLMDQWYNTSLNILYSWATDGQKYFWELIGPSEVLPVETYFPFAEQVASYQSGPQTKFNLTYSPVDATTTMNAIVNGQVFAGCQNPPAFTVNGNVVTWVSPIYGIAPTDTVIFDYHYLANQPPPAPPTPAQPTGSVILYYIAGAGQTIFSLSSPDFFNDTHQLTLDELVTVSLNGTQLMLDNGSGTGGFTVAVSSNVITLLYPVGQGAQIIVEIFDSALVETMTTTQSNASLYYIATNKQTTFNLSTPDLFNNVYTLQTKDVVHVDVSGSRLIPDNGTGIGGYTVNNSTNTVTLVRPAATSSQVIIEVFSPPPALVATLSASLYYIATNGQTTFNLGTPDFFNNSYVLQPNNVVHVNVSGARYMPDDGSGTGGYTIAGNVITLVHPAAPGAQISIDVLEAQ
jgi:hypothetical protein